MPSVYHNPVSFIFLLIFFGLLFCQQSVFFIFHHSLAAQMWCLGKFLPLLIGTLVPDDDEHWQLFQTLLEITDIVLSPVITVHSIGIIEGLIAEHHHLFVQLYPGRSIIPKMHYLVHYPSHMFK